MRDAVVVSTARTPTGKAYRGTLAGTQTQHLAAHALAAAVEEAGIEGGEMEYVVLGCAMQEGTSQLSTRASIRCASRKATASDHAALALDDDIEVGQPRKC